MILRVIIQYDYDCHLEPEVYVLCGPYLVVHCFYSLQNEIQTFESDLINNMDHMHILGNEPSSVILRQTKWFQR